MTKNIKLAGIGMIAALATLSCTKSTDTATTESSSSNVFSSLPEVTGPVTSNVASSLGRYSQLNSPQAATTGVLLSSPGSFTNKSGPMCENVRLVTEIMREASGPDKIMCYMGKMKSTGVLPSSLTIDDGVVHYIKLKNLGEGDSVDPVVRFKIVKTDGAVSLFEMASCFGGSSGSPQQSEYIKQSFSGTTATVVTKNLGGESTMSWGSSMTTTGEYDNGWVSKNINGFRYFNDTQHSYQNVMSINLDQFSDVFKMGIAMNGTASGGTYSNRFYTVAQILNASKLSTLAIGDGSSQAAMSFNDGSQTHSFSGNVSWNGDTKENLSTASSGDYYSLASSGALPTAPSSSQTVTFSTDESWDCTVPSGESFIEADFSSGGTAIQEGMQACNDKFLGDGGEWLQCPYQ